MSRALVAGMILLGSMSQVVAAQDGDRRDYGRPLDTAENRADLAMRFAARCVVDRVPSSARKVLATGIASDDEAKRVRALTGVARDCFQPQWPAFPATAFRDAIAEVTYRKANRTAPERDTAAPPVSFAVVPESQHGSPQQEASWQIAAIAACVVYAGSPEAHHWIVGPRDVEEEERRFVAIKPALAQCVAPAIANQLTARNFRGPIANALLEHAEKKQG